MANLKRLPMPLLDIYEWQDKALCRTSDPGPFFEPDAERGLRKKRREEAAKAVCRSCPVMVPCREHALAVVEEYGIWGGLTPAERQELLHRDRLAS